MTTRTGSGTETMASWGGAQFGSQPSGVWQPSGHTKGPTVIVAVGQIAAVGVVAALALLLVPLELPAEWPGLWRGVGVTGILCTTLALGLMTWGQARVRAEVAAVLFALEPVFAALFEWLFFGAGLGPWQLGGAAVVFGSVVWAARAPVEAEG